MYINKKINKVYSNVFSCCSKQEDFSYTTITSISSMIIPIMSQGVMKSVVNEERLVKSENSNDVDSSCLQYPLSCCDVIEFTILLSFHLITD